MAGTWTKTQYILLIINHNITVSPKASGRRPKRQFGGFQEALSAIGPCPRELMKIHSAHPLCLSYGYDFDLINPGNPDYNALPTWNGVWAPNPAVLSHRRLDISIQSMTPPCSASHHPGSGLHFILTLSKGNSGNLILLQSMR